MWTGVLLYHGTGGISLAMFFVRHGALNSPVIFLPTIPPSTVNGKPTISQISISSIIVVYGKACVEPIDQATELTMLQTRKKGTEKIEAVITIFHTHPSPPICLYIQLDTYPAIQDVSAYRRTAAVLMDPCL
jgi:hypothetical protein